jgi:FolB domain-containing protein
VGAPDDDPLFGADLIEIRSLRVKAHIGVPDEEIASRQTVRVDIALRGRKRFSELGDDIAETIDYEACSVRIAELAAARPRRLIETLADDIAGMILDEFGAVWVRVRVRKFILPKTKHVAVTCERRR